MRAVVVSLVLLCAGATAQAAQGDDAAQLWLAPGSAELGTRVRKLLAIALSARGLGLEELTIPEAHEQSLREPLAAALSAYRSLKIDEAVAALSQLALLAQQLGGGDLDTRSLADLYLHLGLSALERGNNDLVWDSFVRAVRIDPSRALDPAQVPPRAAAAHRRAQTELAQLPTVELELRIPADARARIDGDEGHGPGPVGRRLIAGPHFVRVDLLGYDPYRGVVTLSSPNEIFAPTLRPRSAPGASAASGNQTYAALQRSGDGWRLMLRRPSAGVVVEAAMPVDVATAGRAVTELVDRVFGQPGRAMHKPAWKRWWVWTIAGVAVAAIAIAVPVAVTSSHGSAPGSAGGPLDPVR